MTYYRNISNVPTELRLLLGAACNGTIDADGMFRLESYLRDDGRAMNYYLDCIELHGDIYRVLKWRCIGQAVPVFRVAGGRAEGDAPAVPWHRFALPRPLNVLDFLGGTAQWTREYFSQPGPLSILAATIFMVCLISILSILPAPTYQPSRSNHACTTSVSSPGRKPRDKDGKFNFVARITGLHNCRWSDNYLPPLRYAHLGIGRELKLDSGMVKITYKTGANIILEGPVEFTVEKPNACRLDLGKLSANVSKRAVGFTVETPTATIVDLGTEFGVEVEQGGTADVRVFVGVVDMTDQSGRSHRIAAGQTARVGLNGIIVRKASTGAGQERKFVRSLPRRRSVPGTAEASVSRFVHTGRNNPESEGWMLAGKGAGKANSGNDGMDYWEIDCTGSGIVTLGYRVDSSSPGFLGIIDNPGGWSMKGIVKVTTGNNSVHAPCLRVQDDLGDPNADSRDGNPGTWGDSWTIHLIDTGDPATTGVYTQTLLGGDGGVFLAQVDLSEYHAYEMIMTRGATIQEDSVIYKVDGATIATLARTETYDTQQWWWAVSEGTRFLNAGFGKGTTERDVDSVHRWNSVEFAARNTSSGDEKSEKR